MKEKFSWHSEPGVAPHWYKIHGWLPNRYLPIVMFDSIPIYKPNLKGGHTHNHVKNAHKRMEKRMHKCHSCGELFPKGIRHFVCNSCVEEAKIEAALDMYAKFNGIIRNQ